VALDDQRVSGVTGRDQRDRTGVLVRPLAGMVLRWPAARPGQTQRYADPGAHHDQADRPGDPAPADLAVARDIGQFDPNRNKTIMAPVNSNFLRRSGVGQPDQQPVRRPAVQPGIARAVLGVAHDALHSPEHPVVLRHRAERSQFVEYHSQVRYMVARLRSAYGRHVGDPDWEEDIRRLASMSQEFAELWARQEVAEAEPRTLTYRHPEAGPLSLAVSELTLPDLPEARIVVYTPRDADTRTRMPLTRGTPATAQVIG
jgi:MmyB-like transcription regulator ligand binding domain